MIRLHHPILAPAAPTAAFFIGPTITDPRQCSASTPRLPLPAGAPLPSLPAFLCGRHDGHDGDHWAPQHHHADCGHTLVCAEWDDNRETDLKLEP